MMKICLTDGHTMKVQLLGLALVGLLSLWGSRLAAQDALGPALLLTQQQQYAESSAWLAKYIEQHPQRKYDVGRAWYLDSENLLQLGQYPAALDANDQSIRYRQQLRTMDLAENYLRRAQIYQAMQEPTNALVAVQQGMDMLIEDPRLYADMNVLAAQILIRLGNYTEANEYLRVATDVLAVEVGTSDPAYGSVAYKAGCVLELEGESRAAFTSFAQAYTALDDPLRRSLALLHAYLAYHQKQVNN